MEIIEVRGGEHMLQFRMNFANLLLCLEANVLGVVDTRKCFMKLFLELWILCGKITYELAPDFNQIQQAVVTNKGLLTSINEEKLCWKYNYETWSWSDLLIYLINFENPANWLIRSSARIFSSPDCSNNFRSSALTLCTLIFSSSIPENVHRLLNLFLISRWTM